MLNVMLLFLDVLHERRKVEVTSYERDSPRENVLGRKIPEFKFRSSIFFTEEKHENIFSFYFFLIMTELENYFHICFKVFHSSQSLVVVAHNTQIALAKHNSPIQSLLPFMFFFVYEKMKLNRKEEYIFFFF